jgi:hypothetical protein
MKRSGPKNLLKWITLLTPLLAMAQLEEFRAVKLTNVDSELLASHENIAAGMDYLKSINVNAVLVVVWNSSGSDGDHTLYPSAVMDSLFGRPIHPAYVNRDPLAEVITEAHLRGIEVFPWFEMGFSTSYGQNGGYILDTYPDWALEDVNGNPCQYETIAVSAKQPVLEQLIDRPLHLEVQRHEILLDVPEIPGMGYSTLKLALTESGYDAECQGVSLHLDPNGLPVLENGLIRAEWNHNGTFTLTDLNTKKEFPGIGEFCGEGEAGNAWVHTPEPPFSSSVNGSASFNIRYQGSLMSAIEVTLTYDLDAAAHTGKQDTIQVIYSLFKDSPVLDVKIDLVNQFLNRRLRYALPTSLNAEYAWGEGQFDVVARSTHRPDTSDWVEQPMYDYPLHHFVDVSNQSQGIAVLVDGLKEYEVTEGVDQKLFLTLFRAFTHVVVPSSVEDHGHEMGSQCLGAQSYHLGIMPHSGDWQAGQVARLAQTFNYPFKAMQSSTLDGPLAPRNAFFELDSPDLVLSALKQPEDKQDGLILRLYNPTDRLVTTFLGTCFTLRETYITDLEEIKAIPIPFSNANQLEITIEPKKIMTLRLLVNYE